jgi:hypothetical protein
VACRDCTGRTRSSPGLGLGPHRRQSGGGEEPATVALSESDAQVWREEKERRGRGGGG